jgi:hypothetical protein
MRVFVVSFLVAVAGAVIAATVSVDFGYWVVVLGVLGGFAGMGLLFKGLLFDRKRDAP